MSQQQQPYDSSIKAILKEDAPDILPLLLEGAVLIDVLDVEVLRSPMRVDRVYRIQYRGKLHIFHLEFQAGPDEEMAYRLAVYHTELLREYRLPVISMVVYLFKTSTVESPLREVSGTEEILTFNFHVLPLWTLDARQYTAAHSVSMYTLLPMMGNVDANILLQAIDELIEYCKGNESKLARRLLWLGIFLRRAETVPSLDKKQVKERLDMFDELLEQDEFVQRQRERARQEGITLGEVKGKIEGRAEGKVEAFQEMLIAVVKQRFPSLEPLAQQRATQMKQVEALREVIMLVNTTNDENVARVILTPSAA